MGECDRDVLLSRSSQHLDLDRAAASRSSTIICIRVRIDRYITHLYSYAGIVYVCTDTNVYVYVMCTLVQARVNALE